MPHILSIISIIISSGAVITLVVKFLNWLINKGKRVQRAEHTMTEVCDKLKEVQLILERHTETLQNHENRLDLSESSHEKVLTEIGRLSVSVETFRKENTQIISQLIETLKHDRIKV